MLRLKKRALLSPITTVHPSWSADPIKVIADGFKHSVSLNGVRQIKDFNHGIKL